VISPDGRWQWNGAQWMPVPAAVTEAPAGARSMLAVVGGVVAIAGNAALLAACFMPFVSWDATADYEAGSYSVFGYGPFEVASVGLTLAAGVAAAIILFVLANRLAIALASGLLVAFGLDAVTGWAANSGTYAMDGYHVEPGAFVGVAGGVVLLVGGVIAALSLFARRSA
jgi:hypothetical protein